MRRVQGEGGIQQMRSLQAHWTYEMTSRQVPLVCTLTVMCLACSFVANTLADVQNSSFLFHWKAFTTLSIQGRWSESPDDLNARYMSVSSLSSKYLGWAKPRSIRRRNPPPCATASPNSHARKTVLRVHSDPSSNEASLQLATRRELKVHAWVPLDASTSLHSGKE